ncbi:TlpA family protein disulfide reductase [Flavobacterium sp. RHBU_3]|uniref:TlpA family protein disulfide reductase n=1 Tax=Flavobacterium sp. RHBU_3 TaxID=3391184 RepID=UPI003984D1D5
MKKILAIMLMASAALHAQADKVKFKATIQHANSDSLVIRSRTFKHTIKGTKGAFTDAFSVTPGMYQLFDGTEQTTVFLKNGFDIALTMDAAQFDESIVYKGKGEKENNFLAKLGLEIEKITETLSSGPDAFKAGTAKLDGLLKEIEAPGYDADFAAAMKKDLLYNKQDLERMATQAAAAQKMKGQPSPQFNYENHKGGTTSLASLKGKYVYIDLWATWCGPCRQEIPYLQKLEEHFHGKNIAFVSISIDAVKDHDKWKKFVTDKNLGGIQLMADKEWKSDFPQAYGVDSIPRFILIDPNGNVVETNAKRPSEPKLTEQLEALLK